MEDTRTSSEMLAEIQTQEAEEAAKAQAEQQPAEGVDTSVDTEEEEDKKVEEKPEDDKEDADKEEEPEEEEIEVEKLFDDEEEEEPEKEEKEIDPDKDELSVEEKSLVEKTVDQRLAAQRRSQERISEVDKIVAEAPEMAKFADQIKKYVNHPTMQNIPVWGVAGAVLNKGLLKVGARMERAASKKAAEASLGNQGRKPREGEDGSPNFDTMSKAAFEEYSEKVRRGEIKE